MDDLDVMGLCIYYDRTVTTYKYSLFLSLVDICKNHPSLYKKISKNNETRIEIPMGIMVWKWIEWYYPYYYPHSFVLTGKIYRNDKYDRNGITQNSETSYLFHKLQSKYGYNSDGLNKLSQEVLQSGFPTKEKQNIFISLANYIQTVIITSVMNKFGKSLFKGEYPIFKIESENTAISNGIEKLDIDYLINNLGTFSIPVSLYEEICASNIEKIYDKTRVIENWIKLLVIANDFSCDDVEYIQSLIPSIPGDDEFHCYEYIIYVINTLNTSRDTSIPPVKNEYLYESQFNDFEDESIENQPYEKIERRLYSSLNSLKFEPSVSKIISMLYVYGELSRTQFKTNCKPDELDVYLKQLLNNETIIGYNKNKGKRHNITYYSLNKDLLNIVKEKVAELSKEYDIMRQLVESLIPPIDKKKIYGTPNFEMLRSVSDNGKNTVKSKKKPVESKDFSVHSNDYSVYLEDYPLYPVKITTEPEEKEVVIEENARVKKVEPLDILMEKLENNRFFL